MLLQVCPRKEPRVSIQQSFAGDNLCPRLLSLRPNAACTRNLRLFATESPLLDAALLSENPLLATGHRGFNSQSSMPMMRQIASGMGRSGPSLDDPDRSRAEKETAALVAVWAKLVVLTMVVTAGAVTGLCVGVGGGSWSIRG